MYKNEYLEQCKKEHKGNVYLKRGYNYTKDKKFNKLVINELGFIYNSQEKLQDFKKELLKANIKEFILTDSSSGLMAILHSLNSINIKIKEVAELKYIDNLDNTLIVIQGLKMNVN